MSVLEQNVLSAMAIGLIIALMAHIKNSQLKALVYGLPIPITLALIATGGKVNITNIIGLLLLTLFLWSVWKLNDKGFNIYTADVLATFLYVLVGYIVIKHIKVPFYLGALTYLLAWFSFVILYRKKVAVEKPKQGPKIDPIVKGVIVTVLAYMLLGLRSNLSGIIVTFPFSGVFAVIEGENMLETLASAFTRNSISILAMFVTIYELENMSVGVKIIAGWTACLIVLMTVVKFMPLKRAA